MRLFLLSTVFMFATLAPVILAAQEKSVVIPVPIVNAPAPTSGAYSYRGRNSFIGRNSYRKQVYIGDSDIVVSPPSGPQEQGGFSYQGRNSFRGRYSYQKQVRVKGSDKIIRPPSTQPLIVPQESGAFGYEGRNSHIGLNSYQKQVRPNGASSYQGKYKPKPQYRGWCYNQDKGRYYRVDKNYKCPKPLKDPAKIMEPPSKPAAALY